MADSVLNFGALLAPVLSQVPPPALPRFLAMLERTAADRYRVWAEAWPEQADPILACAGREDEIADRIDAAFPLPEADLEPLRALLPAARDIYYEAFEGMSVREQLRLQAAAELQGATAWRNISARMPDAPATVLAALAVCSGLEEESSRVVEALL